METLHSRLAFHYKDKSTKFEAHLRAEGGELIVAKVDIQIIGA